MAQVSIHVGRDVDMLINSPVRFSGWIVIGVNGQLVHNHDPFIQWRSDDIGHSILRANGRYVGPIQAAGIHRRFGQFKP